MWHQHRPSHLVLCCRQPSPLNSCSSNPSSSTSELHSQDHSTASQCPSPHSTLSTPLNDQQQNQSLPRQQTNTPSPQHPLRQSSLSLLRQRSPHPLNSSPHTRSLHTRRSPHQLVISGSMHSSLNPSSSSSSSISASWIQQRGMGSLITSGMPGPRPEVALEMSTMEGGHIMRLIHSSESIATLDAVLHSHRKVLRPHHVGPACLTLEKLCK